MIFGPQNKDLGAKLDPPKIIFENIFGQKILHHITQKNRGGGGVWLIGR